MWTKSYIFICFFLLIYTNFAKFRNKFITNVSNIDLKQLEQKKETKDKTILTPKYYLINITTFPL